MADEKEAVPNIEWADVPNTGPGVAIDGERVFRDRTAAAAEPKFGTVQNAGWSFLDDQRLRLRMTTTQTGVVEVAIPNDLAMMMLVSLDMIRRRKNLPLPKLTEENTSQHTRLGLGKNVTP
jgi:hypothetical protein